MRIARDGTWFYHGSPIGRKEMVRLFASVLTRKEDGIYWLVTPAEEGIIDVEDVPFIANRLEIEGEGHDRRFTFITNVEDRVELDPDHPLRIAADESGPVPYVRVRGELEARIARPVYYELAAHAETAIGPDGHESLGVWSAGRFFPLEPS